MTETSQKGFSRAFEQICNFLAVSRTGDPAATVDGLVQLCFVLLPDERFAGSDAIQEAVDVLFGLRLPLEQVQSSMDQMLKAGILSQPAGTNLTLSSPKRESLEAGIQKNRDLEERVRNAWFAELEGHVTNLTRESLWSALRDYLCAAFRRHGMQAAALLNPTVETPPQYDESLSSLLDSAVSSRFEPEQRGRARMVISGFLSDVGSDTDRTEYVTALADAAFHFYALEIAPDFGDVLRASLKNLTLFLDTNFLFGLLDLHYSPYVAVSHDLVKAVSEHGLPFKLRYHQATQQEMRNTIHYYGSLLRGRRWTSPLSKAAVRAQSLSGIELKYHEKNAEGSVDVDEFLRPYEHFDELLRKRNIDIYRSSDGSVEEDANLYAEYEQFLKEHGKDDKPYETIMHDVKVLREIRCLRSDAVSSLEAGALLVTCDFFLYLFDWESSRREGRLPCAVLPNLFWQMLRPYVPSGREFEKSFAETFALPEFRALGSVGGAACSKMMSILAAYKDVPEETAFKLLSNGLLLERLRQTRDDDEFKECLEAAFVEENRELIEDKAALAKQVEEEKAKREALAARGEEEARERQEERERLQRELANRDKQLAGKEQELAQVHEEARKKRTDAEQAADGAAQQARDAHAKRELAERAAFWMSVVAGLALGAVLALAFELGVHGLSFEWVLTHDRSLALQIGACVALLLFSVGLCVPKWRKTCWGATGVSGIGFVVLSLI